MQLEEWLQRQWRATDQAAASDTLAVRLKYGARCNFLICTEKDALIRCTANDTGSQLRVFSARIWPICCYTGLFFFFLLFLISNIKVRSVQSSVDNDNIIIVHMLSFGQYSTWFVKRSTVKTPDKCRGGEKFEELLILSTGQHKLPSLAETDCAHCHESPWQRCALSSHSAGD